MEMFIQGKTIHVNLSVKGTALLVMCSEREGGREGGSEGGRERQR